MTTASSRRSGQGGFTLVETLVSMAILGVIAVALFGTSAFYFRSIGTARQQLDRSRVIKTAIDYFQATGQQVLSADTPGYTVAIVQDNAAAIQAGLTSDLKAYKLTALNKDTGLSFDYVFFWK